LRKTIDGNKPSNNAAKNNEMDLSILIVLLEEKKRYPLFRIPF
jgi:hypothetical protein